MGIQKSILVALIIIAARSALSANMKAAEEKIEQ
jgi:hypothetical protein